MARRSTCTDKLADEICERIADGESLRRICPDPRRAARGTVLRSLADHARASVAALIVHSL